MHSPFKLFVLSAITASFATASQPKGVSFSDTVVPLNNLGAHIETFFENQDLDKRSCCNYVCHTLPGGGGTICTCTVCSGEAASYCGKECQDGTG